MKLPSTRLLLVPRVVNRHADVRVAGNDVARRCRRASDRVGIRAFVDFDAGKSIWHCTRAGGVRPNVTTADSVSGRACSLKEDPLCIEAPDHEILHRAVRFEEQETGRKEILHGDLRTIENHFRTARVSVSGEGSLSRPIDSRARTRGHHEIGRTNREDVVGKARIGRWNVEDDRGRDRRDVSRLIKRVIERGAQTPRTTVLGISNDRARERRWIAINDRHARPIEFAQGAVVNIAR